MAYATNEMSAAMSKILASIPGSQNGGIVGDASHTYGYHCSVNQLLRGGARSDYSLQLAGDSPDNPKVDRDAACAMDITIHNSSTMQMVTRRLYDSWKDSNDNRLNGIREAIGTLDGSNVIYMDCQTGYQGSSDSSHLWHVHIGVLRQSAHDVDALNGLVSVMSGKTSPLASSTKNSNDGEKEVFFVKVAKDPTIYLCDNCMNARPLTVADFDDIAYLAKEGLVNLSSRPKGSEGTVVFRGQVVREVGRKSTLGTIA